MEKSAGFMDMLKALIEPLVRKWVESKGLVLGPFRPQGSLMDHLESQQFEDMKTNLMRQAASSDPAPRKILTGLATALGIDPKNIGGQVEDLTEGYAEVAPYFQRWSPEWWDTLHGSSGSTASLASAIADAHRYQDMDAPTAVGMAETIFDEFYSDPMKHRGFSARDLGKIYREGAKRGYFHVGMDPDQMVEEMTPVVGVASAVRDSMPSDYDRSDIAGIFEGIDKTLPAYGNQGWGEMEKHIRTTKHLSPERGGLMAAALRDTPLTGSRTTLPELEAQHARLTQQAAGSPVAAQLAATSRMVQDGLISENSEAARMLEEDPGALAAMNPQEWVAEVGRAGVDQQVAMTMMNQPNEQLITPSLAQAIRQQQYSLDIQPQIDQMHRAFPQKGKTWDSIRSGEQTRIAKGMGYNNWAHLQQLHGKPLQNVQNVRNRAQRLGQQEQMTSHLAQSGPVERVIDDIKRGPTMGSLTTSFFNIQPMQKMSAHQTTIAVDLDGTLAKQMKPYDNNKVGDPRPGAKEAMELLKKKGCKIIINTVRGNDKLVSSWLKEHEIPYDHINENPDQPPGASDKPLADLYIDDRGVDARPAWRKVIEKVVPRIDRMRKEGAEEVLPEDIMQQLLDRSELMGSRGRALKYGRPEPEGRDYDRFIFTDDPNDQQAIMEQMRSLAPLGYQMRERPGGMMTAASPTQDFSVYPTAKRDQIHKAWELIEGGMTKDEAWDQINKQADYRPLGIPDKKNFGDPSKLADIVDMFVQRHDARRAGEHYDYRVGSPETGLLSWATKPTELPEPGQKRFMRQQPVHSHWYGDFQGTIGGTGYGAGTVRQEQKQRVMITKASPTKLEYTVASSGVPERFILLKPEKWGDRDWLLINATPKEVIPYEKVRYKKVPAENVEPLLGQMQEGSSVQAKIDGASSLIKLMRNGAEVVSYRTSKKTGRPIVHTERFFGGRPEMEIPKELVGTVLKGEIYGTRPDRSTQLPSAQPGRAVAEAAKGGPDLEGGGGLDDGDGDRGVIPPQELGGILNASIEKSLGTQRDRGIQLKNMLYDIQQRGKQPVGDVPYAERRKMIEEVLQYLPQDKFHVAEEETTPEGAQNLWRQIVEGKHPLTREGIVIHPPTGKPMKAKQLEESDVHIRSIFPGQGKYHNIGAGGFDYSLSPGGPTVGRVGTGLSDDMRRDMHANPDAYTGRVARIRSQEQLPSGAWRAPAMIGLHEDY